jgi:X-Pro dipeptidyl-peptidase
VVRTVRFVDRHTEPHRAGQDCLGEGTAADTGCYRRYTLLTATRPAEIVTKATLDTENRDSIRVDTPVVPGATYNYTVNLLPEDYVFKPGHRIGVVVAGTNSTVMAVPGTDWCAHPASPGSEPWPKTTFQVNLGTSSLTLPVADQR